MPDNNFPPYGGTTYSNPNAPQQPAFPGLPTPGQGGAPQSPFMVPNFQPPQQRAEPQNDKWKAAIAPGAIQFIEAGRPEIVNQYFRGAPEDEKQREVWKAARPSIDLLAQFGEQYGLIDDPLFLDLANQFQATQQIYQQAGDKEGFQQYAAQFIQQMPQALSQVAQQKRQQALVQQQAEERFNRVLALQSEFAPIFKSVADNTAASNQAMYEQALRSADNLATADPRLAEAIKVNATATRSSNDALLAAYANQIAQTPTWVADMLYRETINQQQMMQNGMQPQPMTGAGGYQGLINAYQAATQPQ